MRQPLPSAQVQADELGHYPAHPLDHLLGSGSRRPNTSTEVDDSFSVEDGRNTGGLSLPKAWSFLSLEKTVRLGTSQSAYPDELGVRYAYDTRVPHHAHVRVGDLAVVRDDKWSRIFRATVRLSPRPHRAGLHGQLPLEQAVLAHQKMEAGDVFGRIVLAPTVLPRRNPAGP